jgi:hypothetical protein
LFWIELYGNAGLPETSCQTHDGRHGCVRQGANHQACYHLQVWEHLLLFHEEQNAFKAQ